MDKVWSDLKKERDFRKIDFSFISDPALNDILAKKSADSKRTYVGHKDFLGTTFTENGNILEIESDQVYCIAKHVSKKSLHHTVITILKQLSKMLVSNQPLYLLDVRRLDPKSPYYDVHSKNKIQYGCFAKSNIPAATVIATYIGHMQLEAPAMDEPSCTMATDDDSQRIHAEDFAMSVEHLPESGEIFIDSKHYGNETAFINDGNDRYGNDNCNARYVSAAVNGVFCIFCVSTRDIMENEQILAKYGKRYWEPRHKQRENHDTDSADSDANSSFSERGLLHPYMLRQKRPCQGFFNESGKTNLVSPTFPNSMEYHTEYRLGGMGGICYAFCVERLLRQKVLMELPQILRQIPETAEPSRKRQRIEAKSCRACKAPPESSFVLTSENVPISEEEDEDTFDNRLNSVTKFFRLIAWQPELSDRERFIRAMEEIRKFIQAAFRTDVMDRSSLHRQLLQLTTKCEERLAEVDPVSILLLGDTGVGKSFLVNLVLLMTMPSNASYGLRSIFKKSEELQAMMSNVAECKLPSFLVETKISSMEGFKDLCKSGFSERVLLDSLVLQTKKKVASASVQSNCVLRCFQRPKTDDIVQDKAALQELLLSCENPLSGAKHEFFLPSRAGSTSTTASLYKARFGRIVHAVVKFQSEEAIREQLCYFDWVVNAKSDGDQELMESHRKILRGLFSLDQWPGEEVFGRTSLNAAAKEYEGKVFFIAGRGVDLHQDRIFVRSVLWDLIYLSDDDESRASYCDDDAESNGNIAALLMSECIVYAPSELLESGIELIDCPGTNDADPLKYATTLSALRIADAVLVLTAKAVTDSVLKMLQRGEIFKDLLTGTCRPLAIVHTCGESGPNLMTNTSFKNKRKAAQVRKALSECCSKSANLLEEALKVYLAKLSPNEADANARLQKAKEARQIVSKRMVSCLPLLWASNSANETPDPVCLRESSGGRLFQILIELRDMASEDGSPGNASRAALAKYVKECEDLIREPTASGRASAKPALAGRVIALRGRIDPALRQSLLQEFDHKVYKPFQQDISKFAGEFLPQFVKPFVAHLDMDKEKARVEKVLESKRATVLANACQKSLRGNYTDLSLFHTIFAPLQRPDNKDSADAFRQGLRRLQDAFVQRLTDFLCEQLSDLNDKSTSGGREQRGQGGRGPAAACRKEIRDAILAHFGADSPRSLRAQAVETFEATLGKLQAAYRGASVVGWLRTVYVRACEDSLRIHVFSEARGIRNGTDAVQVKAAVKELIARRLPLMYKEVGECFIRAAESELQSRGEKLCRRFMYGRVRKGGDTVLTHMLKDCVESLAPASPCTEGAGARDEVELVKHIVSNMRAFLKEKMHAEDGGSGAEEEARRLEEAASSRRKAELQQLMAETRN